MVPMAPEIFYVKYENFYGKDFERAQSIIEFLDIDCKADKIREVSQKFSIDKNIKRASGLNGFGEVDQDSQIHGEHIGDKKGMIFSSSLTEEIKQKIQETYGWFFDIFNYTHY